MKTWQAYLRAVGRHPQETLGPVEAPTEVEAKVLALHAYALTGGRVRRLFVQPDGSGHHTA